MKSVGAVMLAGVAMVATGLALYYAIQPVQDMSHISTTLRSAGMFMGLMGIGVLIAGLLLRLVGYGQPPAIGEP